LKEAKQTITREVRSDGAIEVSVTPVVYDGVNTDWVDESGVRNVGVKSEQDVRAATNIPDSYNTVAFKPNNWVQQVRVSKNKCEPIIAWQAKGTFMPPLADQLAAEKILEELRQASPHVPLMNHKIDISRGKRMLEVSVMDAHFGLACYAPGADQDYDLATARRLYLEAIREILHLGQAYGDIDEILFVAGNDMLHAEPMPSHKSITHGTASGVDQPEMLAWHHVYVYAERTLKLAIEVCSQVAPVRVLVIPGNHDRYSAFTLGRVMNAYFENNENVTVDCDPSPYKFVEWGVNLLGFEHGHSVAPIRLASLMANEKPEAWGRCPYREWHLGDQHRKGTAKPSSFEEQGVSIEYLPSIVAPNEWHRIKAFNHQKRGALGYIWDADDGPIARVGVNLLRAEHFRDATRLR
jgi:hypothetical protein